MLVPLTDTSIFVSGITAALIHSISWVYPQKHLFNLKTQDGFQLFRSCLPRVRQVDLPMQHGDSFIPLISAKIHHSLKVGGLICKVLPSAQKKLLRWGHPLPVPWQIG